VGWSNVTGISEIRIITAGPYLRLVSLEVAAPVYMPRQLTPNTDLNQFYTRLHVSAQLPAVIRA
jgi:hypothetical protein